MSDDDHKDWLRTPAGLRMVLEQVFQEATPEQLHAIALYAVRVMGKTPRAAHRRPT